MSQTPSKKPRLWRIFLPFVVAVAFIVLLTIGLVLPRTDSQISVFADTVLVCFTLLPLVICLSVLYIPIIAAMYGISRLHNGTGSLLGRIDRSVEGVRDRMTPVANRLNKTSIEFSTRLAFIDRIFDSDKDEKNEQQ